jgi:excisionase family DNA binding protein
MVKMADNYEDKDFLTTTQAARLLSVSSDTVLKWVKAGKIESYRTLGGHFRIPTSALDIISPPGDKTVTVLPVSEHPETFQYCWEYLAGEGKIKAECCNCITYLSRARRCYELKDLPGGMGCLNLMCDTDCTNCDYHRLAKGQKLTILVISKNKKIINDADNIDKSHDFQVKFAGNEYQAAVIIQDFRPDYIIVDCALGRKRTGDICSSIFNDKRIPVARIILSSKVKKIDNYCDRKVFGWIRKPFAIEHFRECIRGIPESEIKQG